MNFRVFKGIESDILPDGSLDYGDDLLAGFDFVIASVHAVLDMPMKKMLERFKRAVDHPATTMLGHPTGRLLLKREGNEFDMAALIKHAAAAKVGIEINANPWRLDIDWRYGNQLREHGVVSAVNPDAHHPDQVDYMRYGIAIARKAGLGKHQIANALSRAEFEAWLESR